MGYLKTAIFGAAMFIIGGVIGYKICEKKLYDEYRQEMENIHKKEDKNDEENLVSDEDVVLFTRKKEEIDKKEERHVDYTKFSKPNIFTYADEMRVAGEDEENDDEMRVAGEDEENDDEKEDSEPFEDESEAEEEEEYGDGVEPYLIMEEYYRECLDNGDDCQVLFYYSKDSVVCEEDDTLVEDYSAILGYEFEDVLNVDTKVWVRNPVLKTTYEIHKVDKSYQEAVANVIETPKERAFRHAGRIKNAIDE